MKAIIFDLDGTLVYTEKEARIYLVNKALSVFRKEAPEHECNEFWFMHGRNDMLKKWDVDIDKFWDVFNNKKMVKQRLKHTFAFDDVDVLLELKKKGVKIAIHTGCPPYTAKREIALLPDVFDEIQIADPTGNTKSKPAPDGIHVILDKFGIDMKDAIYVGNSDEDILTTQNAGIYSVLIDRGEHKHDLVPDKKIFSLKDILNIKN